jgi:hypothetical protein
MVFAVTVKVLSQDPFFLPLLLNPPLHKCGEGEIGGEVSKIRAIKGEKVLF